MRVAIFAGGLGTRLREETQFRPKPMVPIGEQPMLWHICKLYAHYGHQDFVVMCGYLGHVIRDYFLGYHHQRSKAITVDLARSGSVEVHDPAPEPWRVTLVDTGAETMTGGRLLRSRSFLEQGTFLATYGDGVADVDVNALVAFHKATGRVATVTAVRPSSRFGELELDGDLVTNFHEKPQTGTGWINGGFFAFEPRIFEYLSGDRTVLEQEPLERLAADRQLAVYRHHGYWRCVDTARDLTTLNDDWRSPKPPWKVWA